MFQRDEKGKLWRKWRKGQKTGVPEEKRVNPKEQSHH